MTKKCSIDAKAFSSALDQVSKVLRKHSYPALSEVFVQVSGGVCKLAATDLNTWLFMDVPAQGDDLAFVFKRSKDVARACRFFDGSMVLEVEPEGKDILRLQIRCGNRTAVFEAFAPELYPDNFSFEVTDTFELNAASLLKRYLHIGYALGSTAKYSTPLHTSVQFSGNYVFALDGVRMAWDVDDAFSAPSPFMVKGDSLSYLSLFGDETVTVELGETLGRFTNGAVTVGFTLPSRECYDPKLAIPPSFEEEFLVSPKLFMREMKFLQGLSTEARPNVRFCGGEMVLPTSIGKYSTTVPLQGHSGITFAFKLNDLMDVMLQFKNEPLVRVKVKNALTPLVMEAEGRSDFALVCPVRLTDKLMAA